MSDLIGAAIKDTGCRPHIEIAWDQWARTRIVCDHGTFEGVSGGLNLQESFDSAAAQFNAYEHIARCWKDTPVPQSWISDEPHGWASGETSECDLWKDHDGPCEIFEDDTREETQRKTRIPVCVPCGKELGYAGDKKWVHAADESARCEAAS